MIKTTDLPALKQHLRTLIREDLSLARFKEDGDGDFTFRYEGFSLTLIFDEDDPAFLWLAMFAIHWIDASDEKAVAAVDRCLNEVNYRVKAVKVTRDQEPDKDGELAVHASIGFLAEDAKSQDEWTLERYLSQIKTGASLFKELIGKAAASPEAGARAATVRH